MKRSSRAGKYGEDESQQESDMPPAPLYSRLQPKVSAATTTQDGDNVQQDKVSTDESKPKAPSLSVEKKENDELKTETTNVQELKPTRVNGMGRTAKDEKNSGALEQPGPPTLAYAATVGPSDDEKQGKVMANTSKEDGKPSSAAPPTLAYAATVGPLDGGKAATVERMANDVHDDLVGSKLSKLQGTLANNRAAAGDVIHSQQVQPGAVAVGGTTQDDTAWRSPEPSERHPNNPVEESGVNDSGGESEAAAPQVIRATRVTEPIMVHATAVPQYCAMLKKHKYKVLGVLVLVVLAGLGVALGVVLPSSDSGSSDEDDAPLPPTLQTVKTRGVLRCGINDKVGFSLIPEGGDEREGFEYDLCRAIAAAVLGESYQLEVVVSTAAERFPIVANGTVDVLAHSATHTMGRDVFESPAGTGFSFSVPYLYDGLGFGGVPPFGSCANNLNTLGECRGLKVCVEAGTTHIDVLRRVLPSSSIVVRDTDKLLFRGFIDGDCNAIAGEQFNIAEVTVRDEGYTGEYEVGDNLFSKEPLALVTRDGDPEWADFVNWVLRALLTAESRNITSTNAVEIGTTDAFGEAFQNLFIDAISAAGNYGDLYNRSLESIVPRQGLNFVYDPMNADSGLLYAHPFGTVLTSPAGPGPVRGGTLEKIVERGSLRCGVTDRTGFAQFNLTTGEWSGLDVDYCVALSASIFGGTAETVEYVETFETTDRFMSLANGTVDVLAGAREVLNRDAVDPELGGVGFSFTQPYFYASSNVDGDLMAGDTLALVTKQNDTQWNDFVYWIVASTFYAEETNITRESSNDLPEVNLFGSQYLRMFRDAVLAVGNYAEIYSRNLESFIPRAAPNELNSLPLGPQHYVFPF